MRAVHIFVLTLHILINIENTVYSHAHTTHTHTLATRRNINKTPRHATRARLSVEWRHIMHAGARLNATNNTRVDLIMKYICAGARGRVKVAYCGRSGYLRAHLRRVFALQISRTHLSTGRAHYLYTRDNLNSKRLAPKCVK